MAIRQQSAERKGKHRPCVEKEEVMGDAVEKDFKVFMRNKTEKELTHCSPAVPRIQTNLNLINDSEYINQFAQVYLTFSRLYG